MANEMRTYVTVKSEDPRVADKLKELFTPREGQYEASAIDLINRIKGTDYCFKEDKEDWNRDTDWPDNHTWEELIGPKWMFVEYDHQDKPENCNIVLRSAWSVPDEFLKVLRDILVEIDEDCYIKGTYEDESYDPCGAFVYGKGWDDFDHTEDEFDWDEHEEDEMYLENFHESLFELEKILEENYFEYLSDKKANPQDYE